MQVHIKVHVGAGTAAWCTLIFIKWVAAQGPREWQQGRTGDAQADLPLLQRLSCSHPEDFWPPVLQRLRVHFHQLPSRCGAPLWFHKDSSARHAALLFRTGN